MSAPTPTPPAPTGLSAPGASPTDASSTGSHSTRRVAAASFAGTTVEWYDFYLYGTASALVFGPLFFPGASPGAGIIAAFSAYAVGFLARPVGSVVAGHLGDRVGRKAVLVASLLLMGATTTLIGLLPGYDRIGVLAPVLLVLLRLVQGFAVGGEWGGAVLLSVEHAGARRRGFFGSITQTGSSAGMLLASGGFALTRGLLTGEQFLAWGWRLPFLASAVLVVVGLVIRLGVADSPVFADAREHQVLSRRPVAQVLRTDRRTVVLTTGLRLSQIGVYVTYTVFSLSYIAAQAGSAGGSGLTGVLVASAVGLVSTPLWGALSDRVGRRPVYRFGAVFSALFVVPFFALVSTGQPLLVVVALVIGINVGHDSMYGPQAAWFAELFSTGVRYSGASIGYAVGAVLGGGITPLVAAALLDLGGGAPWLVAGYLVLLSVPTAVAAWRTPETVDRDITAHPVAAGPGTADPTRTASAPQVA